MAQAVVYMARSPKSTAIYKAYNKAVAAIKTEPNLPVPLHIRNAPTRLMQNLEYGKGYKSPPDNGYVRGCGELSFLPNGMAGEFFDAKDVEPGNRLWPTKAVTPD